MGSQLCRVFPVGLRLKKRRKMFCPKIFIIYCVMRFIRCDDQNILQKIEKLELGLQECKANLQAVTENIQAIESTIESTINITNKNTDNKLESLKLNGEENKKEINSLKHKVNALEDFTEILGVEESCQIFGRVGFTQSGVYPIDPDGKSQNQPPIKATCRLPDGQTTIGKRQEIDIEHCPTTLCHEAPVAYEENLDQLTALTRSSEKCSQEITLICLHAPTKTNGVDNLKWIGVDGIQRTLTGGACNTHVPTLANQTNIITGKNSLPIIKVLYGPLIHESQSANVIIGPLICEPKPLDDWSQINLETHVKTLARKMDSHEISINDTKSSLNEEKVNLETQVKTLAQKMNSPEISFNDATSSLNEKIEKLKKKHKKPVCLGERYRTILGVCYYFEKTKKKFVDALSNCNGKLYEPTDVTTFKEVQREAKSIFGSSDSRIWTGFTKIDNTGNLKHSSTGLKLYGEKTCKILGAPCYLTEGIEQSSIRFYSTSNNWEDRPPTELFQSVCVIG